MATTDGQPSITFSSTSKETIGERPPPTGSPALPSQLHLRKLRGTATTDGQPSFTVSSTPEETTARSGWRRMSTNSKLGSQTPGLRCSQHQSPNNSIHPRLSSQNDEFRLVFIILFSAS